MAKITGLTFILPVRDLDRAAKFYADAFDLKQVFRTKGICFMAAKERLRLRPAARPRERRRRPAERRPARRPRHPARRRRP